MSLSNIASTTQSAASEPVYQHLSYSSLDPPFGVQPGGWQSAAYDKCQPSSGPPVTMPSHLPVPLGWSPSNQYRSIQAAPQHQYGSRPAPDSEVMYRSQQPQLLPNPYFSQNQHLIHHSPTSERPYPSQHAQLTSAPSPVSASIPSIPDANEAAAVDSFFCRPPSVVRVNQACDKCRERKTRCSGGQPICDRCKSRGLSCTYTPGKSTRSRGAAREKRPRIRKTKTEYHPYAAPPAPLARWASADAVPTYASLGRSFEPVPHLEPPVISQTFVHHEVPVFAAELGPTQDVALTITSDTREEKMDWEESVLDPVLHASQSYSSMFNDIIDVSQTAVTSDRPAAKELHPIITTGLNMQRTNSSESAASSCPSSTTESHFSFSSEYSEYSRPASPETMKALECTLAAVIMKSDPTLIRVDHPARETTIIPSQPSHAWPSRPPSAIDRTYQSTSTHEDGPFITSSETIKANKSGGLDVYAQEAGQIADSQGSESREHQAESKDSAVDMILQYPEESDESTYYLHAQPTNGIVPSPSLD